MTGILARAFILSAIFSTVASLSLAEEAVDWKFYGGLPIDGGNSFCFYEANGVVQEPEQHLRVWTKCLPQAALDSIDPEKEFADRIVNAAAAKIAKYYIPPYATLEDIKLDQMLTIVEYEAIANVGHLQPQARIFYELDCSERKLRELSISFKTKGTARSYDTPQDWKYVPPEGNGATLLKMLCPK